MTTPRRGGFSLFGSNLPATNSFGNYSAAGYGGAQQNPWGRPGMGQAQTSPSPFFSLLQSHTPKFNPDYVNGPQTGINPMPWNMGLLGSQPGMLPNMMPSNMVGAPNPFTMTGTVGTMPSNMAGAPNPFSLDFISRQQARGPVSTIYGGPQVSRAPSTTPMNVNLEKLFSMFGRR